MENKREESKRKTRNQEPETRNHVVIEIPPASLELTEEQKKKFLKRFPAKPAKFQPESSN